ncbi:hypothetical protein EVAR_100200_1 [Eumeta japonica]|uniref:Uncharacterized protein n=1 Tax=Eumeta variegata TaxID=151549 RepID=A0A4C1SZP6_EUMVA|nr:hypothetical protein EVAR_100200_1 [Eumeta japonica]
MTVDSRLFCARLARDDSGGKMAPSAYAAPPLAAAAPLRAMKDRCGGHAAARTRRRRPGTLQISADSSRDQAHRVSQQVLPFTPRCPCTEIAPSPRVPPAHSSVLCLPTLYTSSLKNTNFPNSRSERGAADQNGRRASILIADYIRVTASEPGAYVHRGDARQTPHQSIAHVPGLIFPSVATAVPWRAIKWPPRCRERHSDECSPASPLY